MRKVYEELKGEGVYHLSTFMYPKHRKARLAAIREGLKSGTKCIVIATSLVEAGVDLDFQTVSRQQDDATGKEKGISQTALLISFKWRMRRGFRDRSSR